VDTGPTASVLRGAVPSQSMPDRPNVVCIIADDLAYGDLGCHGNTIVDTPHIDDLYGESTRFTRFYGGPVCSPARAELMTGRYSYRTGVTDTYCGRSILRPDEITLAAVLGDAGYRTGCFGKWHLGDEPPSRPEDLGFDETLYHRGGGLCQPGNRRANASGQGYVDPVCTSDGEPVETEGYCTDVFADEAIDFVHESAGGGDPFFVYLATNAPHTPLQVPDEAAAPYRERGCNESLSRLYGMVSNIDANVGRVLDALETAGVADETIVIVTSDHGPSGSSLPATAARAPRYNDGRRGSKGGVYEGGIRVPFIVRWPGGDGGRDVDRTAHFPDCLPTLARAAGADLPTDREIDGVDLRPAIVGEGADWGERRIVRQWHRGDEPELHRNAAVVGERFKLVHGTELYDVQEDPGETHDLAAKHPDVVTDLRTTYEEWFADVTADGFDPVRIEIGHDDTDPVLLTRQDWRGQDGEAHAWSDPTSTGQWPVKFVESGTYRMTVRFRAEPEYESGERVDLRVGSDDYRGRPAGSGPIHTFEGVAVDAGPCRIEATATLGGDRYGAQYVRVERVD